MIEPIASFEAIDPAVGYAAAPLEQPADRSLRWIVAGVAIFDGGLGVTGGVIHFALARGWLHSPSNMSWALDGPFENAMLAVSILLSSGFLVAGLVLLKRRPVAIVALRICVIASLMATVASLTVVLVSNPTYASYWSTPATAFIEAASFIRPTVSIVMIGLLTLPPLARRML